MSESARIALARALLLALLSLPMVACRGKPASPAAALSRLRVPPGWVREQVEAFDRENLYDLVDGQAESYFAYGFQEAGVGRFRNGQGQVIEVGLWRVPTPADAFGLSTVSRSGEPAPIGNDGDTDPGRRLAFWQDRYFAQIWARQELPQADLLAFGSAVAAELPAGGERPALLARLPTDLRDERRLIFFHEELSVESELWLGGENILGLNAQTDGFLVRLPVDGVRAYLLLVQYPDAEAARAASAALSSARLDGPVLCRPRDRLLVAVIGTADDRWLQQVLQGEQE